MYEFETCVMRRISELAGCRFPFDNWAPSTLSICYNENMTTYFNMINKYLLQSELREVVNATGCLVPCIYREYKLAMKPLKELSTKSDR